MKYKAVQISIMVAVVSGAFVTGQWLSRHQQNQNADRANTFFAQKWITYINHNFEFQCPAFIEVKHSPDLGEETYALRCGRSYAEIHCLTENVEPKLEDFDGSPGFLSRYSFEGETCSREVVVKSADTYRNRNGLAIRRWELKEVVDCENKQRREVDVAVPFYGVVIPTKRHWLTVTIESDIEHEPIPREVLDRIVQSIKARTANDD